MSRIVLNSVSAHPLGVSLPMEAIHRAGVEDIQIGTDEKKAGAN